MVHVNMIHDTHLKLSDCQHSHDHWEKTDWCRRKTVRKKPKRVEVDYVAVPYEMKKNENVVLNIDVMFVNGIPFLVTHSRRIGLVKTEYLPGGPAKHIANH